jgi:hypothetical protein
MKTFFRKIPAGIAALAMSVVAPHAKATDLTLDGYGYYSLGSRITYFIDGRYQGGRFGNFGKNYYRRATMRTDFITNWSSYRSGSMSYEFWGMPYYGASKGLIVMTRGLDPLGAGRYYKGRTVEGYAISPDSRRYPEFSLWEYTRKGWRFRDALSFTNRVRL